MNVFELFGKIAIDGSGAMSGIDQTVGHAKKAESNLSKTFKKIGSAVAAAFTVRAVVDFGKQCTQAYANIAAEESAFAQIMGDYADTAQLKLNAVADQTGITSTRMTGAMTSLTAKFKGLGYSTADATTLATDGLLIAADAAAFWDMSLDESMSHLNSFINGSYEGGEAIGLFANDTQMAAYAIEQGIVKDAKAWAQLDEATKQATRLDYAKKMMESSGAVGQAAKESKQYANTLANLKEGWRQFQGVIGNPILEKLVLPGMQRLMKFMPTLTQATQVGIDYLSAGLDKVASYFTDVFTEDGLNTDALSRAFTNVFRDLGKEIPRLLPKIGKALSNLGSMALTAGSSLLTGIYNAITGETVSAEQVEAKLAGMFSSAKTAVDELISAAGGLMGSIYESITGQEATAENIRGTISGIFNAGATAMSDLVEGATGFMNNLATIIGDDTMGAGEKVAAVFNEAGNAMSGLLTGAGTLLSDLYYAITSDQKGAVQLTTFFSELFAKPETWKERMEQAGELLTAETFFGFVEDKANERYSMYYRNMASSMFAGGVVGETQFDAWMSAMEQGGESWTKATQAIEKLYWGDENNLPWEQREGIYRGRFVDTDAEKGEHGYFDFEGTGGGKRWEEINKNNRDWGADGTSGSTGLQGVIVAALQTSFSNLAAEVKAAASAGVSEGVGGITVTGSVTTGNVVLDTGALVGQLTPRINWKLGEKMGRS